MNRLFYDLLLIFHNLFLCYNVGRIFDTGVCNMQQAAGIIAEYNPFHNGHLYHLQQTKEKTNLPVIIIMSGSIMQRGEPAFLDKWTRARLAVANGADLVIELPAAFSLRSAQYFAAGAVALLQACGCVSTLSCGTENPATDFAALASALTSSECSKLLQERLKRGLSYAAASEQVLQQLTGQDIRLDTPNDILALEYSKALLRTDIKPIFIRRRHADYNDTVISGDIASATAIRQAFLIGQKAAVARAVPADVYRELLSLPYDFAACQQMLWLLISYRLRMLTSQQIALSCQCSEGLENVLKRAASCTSLAEAVAKCSSKRYPASRIRRLFLQLLLHRNAEDFAQAEPAYLRILAFNEQGRRLLNDIKKDSPLPLLTKLGRNPFRNQSHAFRQQLELDLAASDLVALLQQRSAGSDFLNSPYYQK